MIRRLAVLFLVTLVLSAPARAGVITFSDSDFNLSNYLASFFTSGSVSGSITNTASGNPGAAVETSLIATGNYQFTAGLLRTDFLYDPTSFGAVSSIDVSIDRLGLRTINGVSVNVPTYTLRPLIYQNGNYYQAVSSALPGNSQWVTLSLTGLSARDFGLYNFSTGLLDTTVRPDFGQAMTFGFISAIFGETGAASTTVTRALTRNDNWIVRVNTVPEPGTLGLLGLGVAAVALARRRRQQAVPK